MDLWSVIAERARVCEQRVDAGPKGTNIDIIPLRLRFSAKLLGKSATIDPISDAIETFGQGFDHINGCIGF